MTRVTAASRKLAVQRKLPVYLRLMRVEQYYKNLLAGIPALFALKLVDHAVYPKLALGFLALSLASSAIYILNDVRDLEVDRAHPTKRLRPLPSGQVSFQEAWALIALLSALALALAVALNAPFALLVALLMLNLTAYSLFLKRVVVIDAVTIAFNYLIRVVSGAVLVDVEASPWLVMGMFSLALFLALSRRRAELALVGPVARRVLSDYSVQWLDKALLMSAAMTVVTYAIYCATAPLGYRLVLTVPLMALLLLRYSLALRAGVGEHPHEVILRDRPTLAVTLAFISAVIALLYFLPCW